MHQEPFTKVFSNGIKVHGFQTGTVAVKKGHFGYSGSGILRFPSILFGKTWSKPVPIWVWLIETPHGKYLVDTGESSVYHNPGHFRNPIDRFVHHTILQINIDVEENIDRQLDRVHVAPEDVDVVILTHLHIDHTDGIRYFPRSEFLVSNTELAKPFGVPFSTFPGWFRANKISHTHTDLPFEGAYRLSEDLTIVSTPGHTFGHQSVLLSVDDVVLFFAGDATFNEHQVIHSQIGGINVSVNKSRKTLRRIKELSQQTHLVYLPSHDPDSGRRLLDLQKTVAE